MQKAEGWEKERNVIDDIIVYIEYTRESTDK
jgi:hypothetical protein